VLPLGITSVQAVFVASVIPGVTIVRAVAFPPIGVI